MPILEDRGIFWWNDQSVADNQFAANSSVGGTLTIDDDGSVRLVLDTVMPGGKYPFEVLVDSGKPISRSIQGLLQGDAGYVLLLDLIASGGTMRTSNLSHERYLALNCLVSKQLFKPDGKKPRIFRSLLVGLDGFEEWLWLQGITVKKGTKTLTAKYKQPADHHYNVSFGKVSIEYGMSGPGFSVSHERKVSLTQFARVRITPSQRMALKDCQTYYGQLEDLVILLTSSDRNLNWPTVISGKQFAKLYFLRSRTEAKPPRAHECLVNFPRIAPAFGNLFATLMQKREEYGPGIYLYLGTRRGMRMFVEHRFVNLIWGLEAFDRRGRGDVHADDALAQKIQRILAQVLAKKDRDWLEKRLQHAGEPNLADRLFAIFSALPLPFDIPGLRQFCKDCQDRRNDISHFGGIRHKDQTYNDFMRDMDRKSDALAALYHLHLLTVIGVDRERLDFGVNHNWPLSRMEMDLMTAGVLPKKTAPDPGPTGATPPPVPVPDAE